MAVDGRIFQASVLSEKMERSKLSTERVILLQVPGVEKSFLESEGRTSNYIQHDMVWYGNIWYDKINVSWLIQSA